MGLIVSNEEGDPSWLGRLDLIKRGVVSQIATAMEAPETVGPNLWQAIKELAANVVPRLEDTGDPVQNARNLMAAAANFGGTIRVGGNPNLMLTHGTSPGDLVQYAGEGGQLVKELKSPSLAITQAEDVLKNPFERGMLLVPRIGAFDPAYSPSTLYNRDAYLARKGDYPILSHATDPTMEVAAARNRARFELSPPPGSEGYMEWAANPDWRTAATTAHDLMLQTSPKFRSFAAYEASPKGAGALTEMNDPNVMYASGRLSADYRNWAAAKNIDPGQNWLDALQTAAQAGDPRAKNILFRAQTSPSEYAELKVSGPVPLTGDRWAGALLTTALPTESLQAIKEALLNRGIYPGDLTQSHAMNLRIAQELQKMAGPVPEQPLSGNAYLPPVKRQFFVEGAPEAPAELDYSSPDALLESAIGAAKKGPIQAPAIGTVAEPTAKSPFTGDIGNDYMQGGYAPHDAWDALVAKLAAGKKLSVMEETLHGELSKALFGDVPQ